MALLCAACGASEPGSDPSPGRGADTAADGAAAASAVAAAMRTSPAAVVALVLAWDTADLRFERGYEGALRRIYCFDPANRCASEEPAWEELAVVDGYQVEPLHEGADSARFQVTHDEIARVWPGGMEASAGSPPLSIMLRRLEGGWRIVAIEPPLTPRLSRSALLRRYSGVAPDSAVLARWLRDR